MSDFLCERGRSPGAGEEAGAGVAGGASRARLRRSEDAQATTSRAPLSAELRDSLHRADGPGRGAQPSASGNRDAVANTFRTSHTVTCGYGACTVLDVRNR